jgi:hypothetical protein
VRPVEVRTDRFACGITHATFIDYGGDCVDYWIFERSLVPGVALCLVDELEQLGGWAKPPPSPRPRFPGSLFCHLPSAQKT